MMQHADPSAQWTTFLPDQPSRWSPAEFEAFLARTRWVIARTMPDNPHEYVLRASCSADDFDEAVRFIRGHGHMEEYEGKPYKVAHVGGWEVWTMGAPLQSTILINRKPL